MMETEDIEILADAISKRIMAQPRWLKIKNAAQYSAYGQKKLMELALDGKIIGYQDPDNGRGDWIFDKQSIDEYRLSHAAFNPEVDIAMNKALDSLYS
ncbi:hypothetical protein [Desulfocicer niacini]